MFLGCTVFLILTCFLVPCWSTVSFIGTYYAQAMFLLEPHFFVLSMFLTSEWVLGMAERKICGVVKYVIQFFLIYCLVKYIYNHFKSANFYDVQSIYLESTVLL